ncbi:class E sortase [Streptomyces sp. NPDC101118]|uniref:class E sortase n=1 Tax=Streptomyces sp. NPDC101118 TaxID=3366109 RepID=UPI003816ACAE
MGAGRLLWGGAELAVTCGLVLLLLVVHQLWWTNREALAEARGQVRALESRWAAGPAEAPGGAVPVEPGGAEPVVEPGASPPVRATVPGGGGRARVEPPRGEEPYAVLRIPRLGVVAPVAQGVGKRAVLDRGYVGHYAGTAQPGQQGNFALAGHRNTHGEPFRYVNRLRAGDLLVVDVRGRRYTYVVDKRLDQTSARDGGVIAPVPRSVVRPSYGYSAPGSYITLTTCTPEFTSKYRLVVWGVLRSSVPR